MEENKAIKQDNRRNIKKVEIHTDELSGHKFEVDWQNRHINNITYASEKIIGVKKLITHPYRYDLKGQIKTMTDKDLLIFEVEDMKTGQRRITIKDETTNMRYPLSPPNVVELMRILSKWISEKEKIIIEDKYNWLIPVINERYAGELIGMILESKDYGVTVKEVTQRFNFPDEQKARNVLFKFKKAKFLTGQRTVTREMFYTPTIDRIELINFIKILYRIGEKDILDWR